MYQIAVATKEFHGLSRHEVASLTRDEVETDLEFAGVLNFANQLRSETPDVIKQLSQAGIQSIMVTGDNLFTGIHICFSDGFLTRELIF